MTRMTYEEWQRHDDMGNCPELLSTSDAAKVEAGEWHRAGGDCVCDGCGRLFYDHRPLKGALWLVKLCDDTLVKL